MKLIIDKLIQFGLLMLVITAIYATGAVVNTVQGNTEDIADLKGMKNVIMRIDFNLRRLMRDQGKPYIDVGEK